MIFLKSDTNLQKDIKNTKVNLNMELIKSIITSIISIPLLSGLLCLLGYNNLVLKYSFIVAICAILPNVISYENKKLNYNNSSKKVKEIKDKIIENDIIVSSHDIKESIIEENNLKNKRVVTYYKLKDRKDKIVMLKEMSRYLNGIKKGRLYLITDDEEIERDKEYINTLKLN